MTGFIMVLICCVVLLVIAAKNQQLQAVVSEQARDLRRLTSDKERMGRAIAFAASVIKSGEPWTEHCERMLFGTKPEECYECGGDGLSMRQGAWGEPMRSIRLAVATLDPSQRPALLAALDRWAMLEELVSCLQSDEIVRDPLGLWHWGESLSGPQIGAHAIDLLHALKALPMRAEESNG